MKQVWAKQKGFTIVELLVVIVVIAILAAITIVAYGGISERAKVARANDDLTQLSKAIQVARLNTNQTLIQLTGNSCTRCGDTDGTRIAASIAKIEAASGTNLSSLKVGDPWGNPYYMDENEGENGSCANHDSISLTVTHTGVSGISIPFYSCPGG